jgi:alpha-glucosidase
MEMSSPPAADADWWRQAVVYQIYPRSFADSNGDGLGDLRGIISRIPYLASLGIDAVWLSPFYPSALADGGYDVDDYRDVDPRLGTLVDFDEMTARLHASGIRVIVDIVPNHTSDRHAWFREALASGKGSPARDRYIFWDGQAPDGAEPPSDWDSMGGGSAWTRVPDGQWYLHLFTAEQPDLNWANREVRDDFLATLRFWSDRGVDGFRVDVAHGLAKNLVAPLATKARLADTPLPPGAHPFWDRDEVHDIYAEWRRVLNEYEPPRTAVAEAWVDRSRRHRYASPEGLGQAFNFDLLDANWDAGQFHPLRAAPGKPGQPPERPGLAAQRRHLAGPGSRTRHPPGPRRHPADAGPARFGVPLPGRGTRPARSRGSSPGAYPGSSVLAVQRDGQRP